MTFALQVGQCKPARTQRERAIVRPAAHARRASRRSRQISCRAEAETEQTSEQATPTSVSGADTSNVKDGDWVAVLQPESLPKGVRKEVQVDGNGVLLFWYRNQIFAIAARSPAEGAYSEGFIKAKFTQDYGIICPTTNSVFSLKDGSVIDWYPSNPVLRAITPEPPTLPIYPVKLTQDAIMVSVNIGAVSMANTRGGSDSSLESNNVFATQPSVYIENSDRDDTQGARPAGLSTVLTFTVSIAAFAIIATAGTATALFYEDYLLLGAFWLLLATSGGYFTYQYFQTRDKSAQT